MTEAKFPMRIGLLRRRQAVRLLDRLCGSHVRWYAEHLGGNAFTITLRGEDDEVEWVLDSLGLEH